VVNFSPHPTAVNGRVFKELQGEVLVHLVTGKSHRFQLPTGESGYGYIPAQCIGRADNLLEGHCLKDCASIRPETALINR
jgi:hypothetical protein